MVRDLATILKWSLLSVNINSLRFSQVQQATEMTLLGILTEMLNCTMTQSRDPEIDLLRKYLDRSAAPSAAYAFGDIAGTSEILRALRS